MTGGKEADLTARVWDTPIFDKLRDEQPGALRDLSAFPPPAPAPTPRRRQRRKPQ